MKRVKLIIWDLDDTFWKGTFSEGTIQYVQQNHETVIELARRGIMSAICSKNNYDDVRQRLMLHVIWDWFVFPKIAWQPKGAMVAELIADMHLRPENVLFIDDNPLNLNEALFYCPGLQTSSPEILAGLLSLDVCAGSPDLGLSRLLHYKLLEKKHADRVSAQCGNEKFLRSCGITVRMHHDCGGRVKRLLELINRTSQLNYTKRWLTLRELEEVVQDPGMETGFVQVQDTYGDYGISGFYAKRNGRLEHFLFSCRIMNMGVENWVYKKLGCPRIDVAGPVAMPLSPDSPCDWITEAATEAAPVNRPPKNSCKSLSIIVKGSCDLLQIQNYLLKGSLFDCEVSYLSAAGYRMNVSHTEILKRCNLHTLTSYGPIIDKLHFLDRSAFRTNFFSGGHKVYVYSVLDNYTKGLYRYRNSDFIIAFGDYTVDLTDPAVWDYHGHRSPKHRLPKSFLEWFRDNFVFLGPLDCDGFKQNMAWLCDQIDSDRLLIILNGSEVQCRSPSENDRWLRHSEMNRALDEVMALMPHAALCDVRQFAQTRADHPHNIRSYSRRVYFNIAQHINHIIEQRRSVSSGLWQKGLLKCRYWLPVSPKTEKRTAFRYALEKKKAMLEQLG
jgi:FkbH-like protein